MADFSSWRSFSDFQRHVKFEYRYVTDDKIRDFLNVLLEKVVERTFTLKKGYPLYRAQLGHDWRKVDDDIEIPTSFGITRMKPLFRGASQGRANPSGIPCLYLSNKADTAMSEVRPWVGEFVTLAKFSMNRDLKIVDFSKIEGNLNIYFEEPCQEERNKAVLESINKSFSKPVRGTDDVIDYVPTQMIAEQIRKAGYDGIAYKSVFGENGYNIALFDLDSADVVGISLQKAESIKCEFKVEDGPFKVVL